MGSALEWALALLRAPGERHVLRQRPLPQEGMEELLGIAAGAAPEVLAEQARRFGESEAQVLEAARFYAREVLFHPQADAYRVLGVDPQASADTIKGHYRLLQLWLHPDRTRSEDDVVFAARVNSAWNRLRSAERRRAYDDALRAARPPEIFDSSGALRSVRTWVPAAEPVVPPSPWRRRWPALALLALCGVLALLALRDMERADAEWEASQVTPDAGHRREPEPIASLLPSPGADADAVSKRQLSPTPRQGENASVERQPANPHPTESRIGVSALPQAEQVSSIPMAGRHPASDAAGSGAPSLPGAIAHQPALAAGRAESISAHQHQPTVTQRPAAVGNQASVPTETSPASPSVVQPEFAKVESARLTGAQLLDYLRAPRRPAPPIWSSPAVETDAARLRQELHAEGRVRLGEAQWRIGSDNAVLESAVVAGRAPRGGVLTARLRWRDGYWLVTGMDMESTR